MLKKSKKNKMKLRIRNKSRKVKGGTIHKNSVSKNTASVLRKRDTPVIKVKRMENKNKDIEKNNIEEWYKLADKQYNDKKRIHITIQKYCWTLRIKRE